MRRQEQVQIIADRIENNYGSWEMDPADLVMIGNMVTMNETLAIIADRLPEKTDPEDLCWIKGKNGAFYCPKCGEYAKLSINDHGNILIQLSKYCPNCGAHLNDKNIEK